ncbi:uncharacterized protein CTRU02_215467 [Colletotrichum truncatum]|uniref:Uncharacterized protein n=1 Tax=Colletotrichum truncatum TaxID=5467 RepID=A0ACC3YCI6_COLTU|nr:uncharacterized protein CTRU02_05590 [Colletotrichum truncatum]KAF6794033.1 hypothetical protein CTRU02_05590 [Colletotrichum truncatum]
MNGAVGDRFMSYLVGCLRGPLHGREFITKIAALLACFKIRSKSTTSDLWQKGNLVFELDKIMDYDFRHVYVSMRVLEQTLRFSVQALEIQSPGESFARGLLPPSYGHNPGLVSSRQLQLYCCIRSLFPSTHEASMFRVHRLTEPASFDLPRSIKGSSESDFDFEFSSQIESESDVLSSEDEHTESSISESDFNTEPTMSDDYRSGESSESYIDEVDDLD